MAFLNINIRNSFNKNKDSHNDAEDVFSNAATLNSAKDVFKTYSASVGSITSGYATDDNTCIIKNKNRKGLWKNIIINIIIGTLSAVLGAVIIYFVFGIK